MVPVTAKGDTVVVVTPFGATVGARGDCARAKRRSYAGARKECRKNFIDAHARFGAGFRRGRWIWRGNIGLRAARCSPEFASVRGAIPRGIAKMYFGEAVGMSFSPFSLFFTDRK
jgi:hypothetical protein